MNSSVIYSDFTSNSNNRAAEFLRIIFEILTVMFFLLFLYFLSLMLHVFFTTAHVRDNARYILFIHMLINDTLYLAAGLTLFMLSMFLVYIPVPVCYVIVTLASVTFRITPYNLLAMAVERYVAICFPLRHVTLCTSQRTNYIITSIWVIGLIPNIADFIVLRSSVENSFFSQKVICLQATVTLKSVQISISSNILIISLILVGLIIVFTYIRVMLIARRMNSGSSASKAGKTIMLHAFHFLLCIVSLLSPITDSYLRRYSNVLPIVDFLFLSCLPRCLSPLIYGIRDNVFRKRIKQFCLTNLKD
ncbi:odorant receptor 131-2-like [Pseudophryne corroboree]|uniref:odorant receptor 131-2-like n=1 Tax=Pseudophryne corroboree TaxID=495146 RepID=UPI003081A0E1